MTSGGTSFDQDERLQLLASQGITPSMALASQITEAADAWEPPTPEELQQQLAQYRILGLLGRGGMGAVYKGWQVSLDRYVAIKILPPGMDHGDAQFSERFKQEAKTMAKVQHPGIVAVHDAGETTGGLLYIVMEFVEGTDLAQMVKSQGSLAAGQVIEIAMKICDALQYAHAQGVIHRDIKPANIMLSRDGAVKVGDFGLAKGVDHAHSGGLTKTNMAMGTPDYVAPETLMKGEVVDHRADLFAVGVMLYNMLTGRVPRGMFQMPSVKCGTDLRFDRIITRAMQTELESRYQSALEIRRDLEDILARPAAAKQEAAPQAKAGPASTEASGLFVRRVPSTIIGQGATMAITLSAAAVIALGAFFAIHKPRGDAAGGDTSGALLRRYTTSIQAALATAAPTDRPAFEAEIARLAGREPLPDADDPKLPAALRELRQGLRKQLAKDQ